MDMWQVGAQTRVVMVGEKLHQCQMIATVWEAPGRPVPPTRYVAAYSLTGAHWGLPEAPADRAVLVDPVWSALDSGRVLRWDGAVCVRTGEGVAEVLRSADLVVSICDSDRMGVRVFSNLLATQVGWDVGARAFPVCWLDSYAPEAIREGLRMMMDTHTPVWVDLGTQNRTKAAFDTTWALASRHAITPVAVAQGCAPGTWLSKYQVQVLYEMAGRLATEGTVLQAMQDWPGQGPWAGQRIRMGSPVSSSAILEQMEKWGVLDRVGRRLMLSRAGAGLVRALGSRFYDPNLPFRLEAWMGEGDAARPAMGAYLARRFGPQLRAEGSVGGRVLL